MIRLRAPGRICLFGEHQDYLNYPVISMAISKYIFLEAKKSNKLRIAVSLPDIDQKIEIPLNNMELAYDSKRDYLRSGYNQFIRKGIKFKKGYDIKIKGDIPINAGAASSSALVIAWISFLNLITNSRLDKIQLAMEGYNSEVKEFREGGGMMDHFTSVCGKVIYLDPLNPLNVLNFDVNLNGFVLGDSLEKKSTVDDLIRTKQLAIEAFNVLKEVIPNFNPYTTSYNDIEKFLPNLSKEHRKKIVGNIINRDLTTKAKYLILKNVNLLKNQKKRKELDRFYLEFGTLLNLHHDQLKNNIGSSTAKIDRMINASLKNGALGAKINGSGFGGTMFALSIGNEAQVKRAIEEVGGKVYLIKTSNGVENY